VLRRRSVSIRTSRVVRALADQLAGVVRAEVSNAESATRLDPDSLSASRAMLARRA